MKLYSYWRSTTAYRARAALNLKGVDYEIATINLLDGEQNQADFLALNSGACVPVLQLDNGSTISQSLAIIEYLDSVYPTPRLIPRDPHQRGKVTSLAHCIALDIHPLNNLRVIEQLKIRFAADTRQIKLWIQHWIRTGFSAIESHLSGGASFAFGTEPGLADICIVAQVYNARRWEVDMTSFPRIQRIESACLSLPAIAAAHPDNQPDARKAV